MRRIAVVAVGLGCGATAALVAEVPAADAVTLIALSFGVASAAYAAGRLFLRRRQHPVVVAVIPIVSLVVGSLVAAKAMFVSAHDLTALVVVIIGSGTAGVLGALALADALAAARRGTEEAAARERDLERNRRQLVAWVSHDLRTPLAGVRAMVEALDDGVVSGDSDVRDYHHRVLAEVERLSRLVDDLFILSRIDADAVRLTVEQVPVARLVTDAIGASSAVAMAKGVQITGSRLSDVTVSVDGSAPELTRVVRNLLDNAIRHTPQDGTIEVEVTELGGCAEISVLDGCGGIPDHELERVFDVAYRGDAARTPSAQGDGAGAGLGLAIARGLVEAHEGDIDVRNEAHGCRFTVRLPRT